MKADSEGFLGWLANEKKDGPCIGYAFGTAMFDVGEGNFMIEFIEVDKKQRGDGIAKELLKKIENSAKTAGYSMLYLAALKGKQFGEDYGDKLIKSYEKAGYSVYDTSSEVHTMMTKE